MYCTKSKARGGLLENTFSPLYSIAFLMLSPPLGMKGTERRNGRTDASV